MRTQRILLLFSVALLCAAVAGPPSPASAITALADPPGKFFFYCELSKRPKGATQHEVLDSQSFAIAAPPYRLKAFEKELHLKKGRARADIVIGAAEEGMSVGITIRDTKTNVAALGEGSSMNFEGAKELPYSVQTLTILTEGNTEYMSFCDYGTDESAVHGATITVP